MKHRSSSYYPTRKKDNSRSSMPKMIALVPVRTVIAIAPVGRSRPLRMSSAKSSSSLVVAFSSSTGIT